MKIKYTLAFLLLVSPAFIGNAFADPVNEYDRQGRITKTTYDDGSYDSYSYYSGGRTYKYTYNAAGQRTEQYDYPNATAFTNNAPTTKYEWTYDGNGNYTSVTSYYSAESVANNTPDYKSVYTYDGNGRTTSSTYYKSAEAVANNTPTTKYEYTYDENRKQTSYTYYSSTESIENNTPDFKNESTYDENGSLLSSKHEYYRYDSLEARENQTPDYKSESYTTYDGNWNRLTDLTVEYNSAEAVANNTPDYKISLEKTDQGYITSEYTSADSIQNNTPDYYRFSQQSYGGVIYDKNGRFSGTKGYYSSEGFDIITYDDEGRIIGARNSGYTSGTVFTHNEDGTVTVSYWWGDEVFDSAEEAYEYIFGFIPALNLADSEYAGWITLSSANNSSPSSSSGLDRQRGRLIYTVKEANKVAKEGAVNKIRLRYK